MTKSIVQRIQTYNTDRIPALLALKYKAMSASPLAFFRGSCHLFYEDWPTDSALNAAPLAWVCGDLHLENFGSYKGENRQVYFDVNDFDEAALAPCAWDAARFLTSLFLAAPNLQTSADETLALGNYFLEIYFATLAKGQIHHVERASATGPVKKLMRGLKSRSRADFLDQRSRKTKNGRKFRADNIRYMPVSEAERKDVTTLVQSLVKSEKDAKFYKIHDIAFRIAGTGSLGLRRYAALVEGRGSPAENFILDIKEIRASALEPALNVPQPKWANSAERAAAIQKRLQAMPPALLTTAHLENQAYLIKELQPAQDRLNLVELAGKPRSTRILITSMAEILAWGELRSVGRGGSASADELIAFGEKSALKMDLLEYASQYAGRVEKDFKKFASAYAAGKLEKSDE